MTVTPDLSDRQKKVLRRIGDATRWIGGLPAAFLDQTDARAAAALIDLCGVRRGPVRMPNGESVVAFFQGEQQ